MAEFPPPFYLLLAHSPLSNLPTGALSNTLAHPVVQYHYADDSPLSIMPTQPDEHVLVFDYNPKSKPANIQSISDTLAVTGLRVEEAPGAVANDAGVNRNTSMFIVETTTNDHHMAATHMDRKAAQATLAQFKHRNNVLRRVLEYPPNSHHVSTFRLSESPQAVINLSTEA